LNRAGDLITIIVAATGSPHTAIQSLNRCQSEELMNATQIDSRQAKLSDVPLKQLTAPLAPLMLPRERRNIESRVALLHRICNEFDEMPGTALTPAQAQRLFGIGSNEICDRILIRLVSEGRLRRTADGRFRLSTAAA
jgi:hypothetical protein